MSEPTTTGGLDIISIVKSAGAFIGSALVGAFGAHKATMARHSSINSGLLERLEKIEKCIEVSDHDERLQRLEDFTSAEKARVDDFIRRFERTRAEDRNLQVSMHKQNRGSMEEMRGDIRELTKALTEVWKVKAQEGEYGRWAKSAD